MPNGDPMTPVQLPEVPEPSWLGCAYGTEEDITGYTADQLRAYATAAVLADRERAWANAKWIETDPTGAEQ